MTTLEKEKLALARECFRKGDDSEGIGYYAVVHAENPENAEANYFCGYADYVSSVSKKSGVKDAVVSLMNSLENAIKYVAESEGTKSEKLAVVRAIVDTYTPITNYITSARISTTKDTIEYGVLSLYWLGMYIENNFDSDSEAMKLAIIPWKEGVLLQQKFYAYKYEGVKAEDYVAKIQKVDPTYTIPKKAGCISIG